MIDVVKQDKAFQKAREQVRDCGRALIREADKIVAGYDLQSGEIRIEIVLSDGGVPRVKVINELSVLPSEEHLNLGFADAHGHDDADTPLLRSAT